MTLTYTGRERDEAGRHDDCYNTIYTMWLYGDTSPKVGVDRSSYGYAPPFQQLSKQNQKYVARIIAEKGPNIVHAAGLDEYVHQHNIRVMGVKRTRQAVY